jgi:hypothetical protein
MRARRALSPLTLAFVATLALLAPFTAGAVEYSAEPSVSLRSLYNDNFDLTTSSHPTVWGITLEPSVRLNAESDNWKVTGGADLKFNHYSESVLNHTEGALSLHSNYRAERNTLGLNFDLIRDNTLVGELAATGVAQAYTPRTQVSIAPSWTRALTEKTNLVVDYNFTAVSYSDTAGTSLIDYREQIVNAGVEHKLAERTTASLSAYYDFFETDPANFQAQTVGVLAGLTQDFSETLRGSVKAGPRWTRSKTAPAATICNGPIVSGVCTGSVTTLTSEAQTDSSGYTLTGELTKRWETGSVSVRAGRELVPSGVGAMVQTDLARVSVSQEVSPTVAAVLDAGIYRSKYVGAAIDENKSRYLRVEPHVSWRMTPQWTLDAGYAFARQKYDTQPDAATANIIYVTLSYTWQKIAVSR